MTLEFKIASIDDLDVEFEKNIKWGDENEKNYIIIYCLYFSLFL